jgi:hypothetical protein
LVAGCYVKNRLADKDKPGPVVERIPIRETIKEILLKQVESENISL